jgi:hypothetical protein
MKMPGEPVELSLLEAGVTSVEDAGVQPDSVDRVQQHEAKYFVVVLFR